MIYGGTRGTLVCLDEVTGREAWRLELKSGVFGPSGDVAVLLRGNVVVAACNGEIWGVDARSGRMLWHNELPGLGYGFVSLCDETHSVQYIRHVETQTNHSPHS